MGLTKPRAAQIYNLDYKQSTRVVTVANVTLSGGAPATVDGVTLNLNDRILVTGQSTGSQNGLYYVTIVGSGSNGTWARTSDGNETGEIEAGMIIMVTAGNIYADTQWKLTTDDPITIGSTALTFVQNYSANSISGGTSNVAVFSNANVTVSSAGTANVLTVSSTGTVTSGTASATGNVTGGNILTAGLISATGNVTGNYFLGNVFFANGITASKIYNGTSEVNVVSSGGNVNVSVGGTANVVVFSSTGQFTNGIVSASGNITGGNISATNHTGTTVSVTANVTGGNVLTGGLISATGNITGGNISATALTGTTVSVTANVTGGNVLTGGLISATGNITGGNILGGANVNATTHTGTTVSVTANVTGGNILTGGLISSTGNVTGGNILTAGLISATGNITGGNILGGANVNATTHTGTTVSVTANVTGGNVLTGGLISATGNITGGNILGGANVNATTHTGTTVSVTANVTGGNILTAGLISATGNITGANLVGNVFSPAQVVINANGQTEGGQLVMAWANVGNLTGQGNGSWNIDVDSSNTLRTFYQNTTGTTNVMFALNSTTQTANFSGNIGATYYYGNGAFLTGISGGGGGGGSSIANGATNISIPVASGNIAMSVAGQSNTVVINLGSLTMYGAFAGPKMLEANVSVANAVNGVIFGPVTVGNNFNITVPNASTVYIYSGT
jgi:hypothetical protein